MLKFCATFAVATPWDGLPCAGQLLSSLQLIWLTFEKLRLCHRGQLLLVLQDHVKLDAVKPVAVQCCFDGNTDGLARVQVHKLSYHTCTAVILPLVSVRQCCL